MKCRASRGFLSIFIALLCACVARADDNPAPAATELPVVKLSPSVRMATRDRAWFDGLPCEQVGEVRATDADESRWLEERKQACVRQYQGYGKGSLR
ncbi:MAG TPA: hypothetical protein VIM96_10850 [Pseudomonadales bacterium]